jgi:gamma-glutamylcyclotransferase (GGCT)/AIG2-like uncharacterized protein YtfP
MTICHDGLFTSESASAGHPDRVGDQINDATVRRGRRPYFSYGINLSGSVMRMRCASASYVCTAQVQGQFRINRFGTATIVLDRPMRVYGALWMITPADEMALDEFEGVEFGLYQKRELDVLTQCGKRVAALAYVSSESRPGRSRARYLTEIITAAIRARKHRNLESRSNRQALRFAILTLALILFISER